MKIKKSRMPLEVDKKNWIYHYWEGHILMVHQVYDKSGKLIQTDQIEIPRKIIEKIWDHEKDD